jgi:hypothetical protein
MRTAALPASARTTRPDATNFSGQVPPSRAGQFIEISTWRPRGSLSSVVKSNPPLPTLRVFPEPLTLEDLCNTRYFKSSLTGNLLVRLRSVAPPCTTCASYSLSCIACPLCSVSCVATIVRRFGSARKISGTFVQFTMLTSTLTPIFGNPLEALSKKNLLCLFVMLASWIANICGDCSRTYVAARQT